MLKKSRKGLKHCIKENGETRFYEWKEPNLIRVLGRFDTTSSDLLETCRNNKSLIVTKDTAKYRGIRCIEKESVGVHDIKMIEDILEIYPDYSLVVYDETLKPVNQCEFYKALVKITKRFENVIFIWTSKISTNKQSEKTFFSDKNVFLRSI